MSAGHTKGPWRRGTSCNSIVSDFPVVDGIDGADDVRFYGGYLIAESCAEVNIPLLSAAPEMLYALTMVRDADNDCQRDGLPTIPHPARAKIDAAINKATGESS